LKRECLNPSEDEICKKKMKCIPEWHEENLSERIQSDEGMNFGEPLIRYFALKALISPPFSNRFTIWNTSSFFGKNSPPISLWKIEEDKTILLQCNLDFVSFIGIPVFELCKQFTLDERMKYNEDYISGKLQ